MKSTLDLDLDATKSNMNDPKVINGWAIFDWANSAYALVIAVAIFPIYFLSTTSDIIYVFGKPFSNSAIYAFSISFAYIIIAIASPMLSGIADYSGRKKMFMRFFTTLGSFACISLFFFEGSNSFIKPENNWMLGTVAFVLATIGFSGGLVFYNSYLPEIVTKDRYDKVSAKGFAFGYVGSVLLLIVNLLVIHNASSLGITDGFAARIAFVMVGLWWFSFAQITFKRLPADLKHETDGNVISKGYKEIAKVWKTIKTQWNIKGFLFAFFCYSAGVQTVLYLASTFAEKELHFSATELIIVVLILQIVAIGGAYLFAQISKLKGNKVSLLLMLTIWTSICFIAYFVQYKYQFYGVAAGVGMVMGGIQSVSRSTYSKLIPANTTETTSYFSFYDILEKSSIVMGTLSFGIIESITGDMRMSVLALAGFFVVGILLLSTIKIEAIKKS